MECAEFHPASPRFETLRPEYFDRNPQKKGGQAFLDIGNATQGATVTWAYTVPAAKRAYLEVALAIAAAKGATAPDGQIDSAVRLTNAVMTNARIAQAYVLNGQASPVVDRMHWGASIWMNTGDKVDDLTAAAGTANGSGRFMATGAVLTEFDV